MLQNAYLHTKIGADTAENEQHFAKNLRKTDNYPTGPERVRRAQRAGERVDLRQVREQLGAHLRGQPWRLKNQELQEVREWCRSPEKIWTSCNRDRRGLTL